MSGMGSAAPSESPAQPEESTLLQFCNMGYARGSCPRFPSVDGPDAARFTISGDDHRAIHVYFVLERNHHPWSHGPLEFSADTAELLTPHGADSIAPLARAYVASYRRRISEAAPR